MFGIETDSAWQRSSSVPRASLRASPARLCRGIAVLERKHCKFCTLPIHKNPFIINHIIHSKRLYVTPGPRWSLPVSLSLLHCVARSVPRCISLDLCLSPSFSLLLLLSRSRSFSLSFSLSLSPLFSLSLSLSLSYACSRAFSLTLSLSSITLTLTPSSEWRPVGIAGGPVRRTCPQG